MPFDALGRTRATMMESESMFYRRRIIKFHESNLVGFFSHFFLERPDLRRLGNHLSFRHGGDRTLELLILNMEFLVSTSEQLVLITSLPFVHTARRSYRLDNAVKM